MRPTRSVRYWLLGAALLLVACGRKSAPPEAVGSSKPAASPPARAGSAIAALSRLTNTKLTFEPPLEPGERRPLMLFLHGFGDSGQNFVRPGWADFAARHRIAWIAPDGTEDSAGQRFWNAGPSCCNFDEIPVDHVRALRELLETAIRGGGIDDGKVFVLGFSNGGFMAHRLACELEGLVKAVVSVAGAGPVDAATCRRTAPLRVLQIHGDADQVVTYEGGTMVRRGGYRQHLPTRRTVSDWAGRLGCAPDPKPLRELDFERQLPGAETRVEGFEGCRGAVELWTVRGGPHVIGFRAPSQAAIWAFLNPG